jgi:hypothetical protein
MNHLRQRRTLPHNHAMSQPARARQQDYSRLGWLGRRLPNWWLRFAVPGLIIFGGGFVFRILSKRTDDIGLYLYGTLATLGMVALVVGLIKARQTGSRLR